MVCGMLNPFNEKTILYEHCKTFSVSQYWKISYWLGRITMIFRTDSFLHISILSEMIENTTVKGKFFKKFPEYVGNLVCISMYIVACQGKGVSSFPPYTAKISGAKTAPLVGCFAGLRGILLWDRIVTNQSQVITISSHSLSTGDTKS